MLQNRPDYLQTWIDYTFSTVTDFTACSSMYPQLYKNVVLPRNGSVLHSMALSKMGVSVQKHGAVYDHTTSLALTGQFVAYENFCIRLI